ncbi:60S ribosomal protein L18a-2 [Zea mays]|uniref:60S ribosomal protein L18a-2 n=1 Tax=Zea mays TaxID=4577 RepID=A0A1D6F575_MAIZE|nr:60S ribosomal protein L18a-2 [Zea mays]
MVPWSRCTMRRLPVCHPTYRSSRRQQSTLSFARGTTPSSSTIQSSSFLWFTATSQATK